jgi:glycosyltransferase involved in cell wall biosynthesis
VCDNVIPHEQRPGDRLFTRYAFGAVDSYIVQSKAVERDLHSIVADPRYKVVPHPVYEIFGQSLTKVEARRRLRMTDERVILFFGYIRRYKGLHVLIEAMKYVKEQMQVKALVAGEFYEDEKPYHAQMDLLGVEDVIRIVPEYIPNEQVADYFCAADAVVLPYVSATQSGIAQIAYNFDKPVIVTDVGGLSEVIIDGVSGLVVPPNNPRALASAIVRFYEEQMEERLSAGARQEKKKYSWEAMVEAVESLATSDDLK